MQITVLGGGSWGTALARLLALKGLKVHLWVREPELAELIRARRENPWFLPGVDLPPELSVDSNLERSIAFSSGIFLLVVPCQFIRSVLSSAREFFPSDPIFLCASKGIELGSLKPMSVVVAEAMAPKPCRYAILSGPSFARDVSEGKPTAVSLGCENLALAEELQRMMSTETFRVYTNPDFRGVELGGAIKNVMAIAAGISDGLDFGTSARAALVTRGLAEMSRLGSAMGADGRTFMGLSGIGDLVLTCTGDLSRNRQVGLRIGAGESLEAVLASMNMVAEGVKTTQAVYELAGRLGLDMPITAQVQAMLYDGKAPSIAVRELMSRSLKEE
ncbi:MAG: NAD(P)-dependent glycerol-3-phosphate dehydrogenase [Deltaproteobacteria bacterium]|nr:NAD(P)-dependent glycerol-3-phosphate dehydrogenase [Deltaproteobacteria bacterium]